MFPGLTEDQAELFANFLTQLAPKVAPKIVEEISEIVKDIQTEMTDSDIAKLAEMTKQLTHEVTPQQVTNEHRNLLYDTSMTSFANIQSTITQGLSFNPKIKHLVNCQLNFFLLLHNDHHYWVWVLL